MRDLRGGRPAMRGTVQIDYLAHDDTPYASGDCDDVYGAVKRAGRFRPTQRTAGISTSDLIMRIVRDYDEYIRRNLARGYTARDLNVGFVKEHQVRLSGTMQSLREKLRLGVERLEDASYRLLQRWEEQRHLLIDGFSRLFFMQVAAAHTASKRGAATDADMP